MADFYTLTKSSIAALQKDHQRLRTAVKNLQTNEMRLSHKGSQRENIRIGKAQDSVAARSGANMSGGTFDIQDVSEAGSLSNSGATATAYNVSGETITQGAYVPLVRDYQTGHWITRPLPAGGGSTTVVEADICYVVAQSYWTYTGSDYPSTTSAIIASVSVKKCDADGTPDGDAFTCWLPICNTGCDPNVVTGQIFTAGKFIDPSDSSETWAALSGHEDAAIGTVRMLTGNFPANDATGWAEMDGNQDAAESAAGVAIDMDGAVPKHAAAVNADNGGVDTPNGNTSTDNDGGHAVTITTTQVTTDSSETGINSTDASDAGTVEATTAEVEEADMMPTTVVDGITGGDDLEHSHTIPDPGHTHTLTGTFTGSMDAYEHSHTHQIQKTMTLRFYERIDNSA